MPRSRSALFSSGGPYNNFMDGQNNNFGGGMSDGQRKTVRMVKQFNGDFKAVPYSEGDEYRNNMGMFSEMGTVASRYRGENPNLTSPARNMLSKQWDWRRPGPDSPKPRFRQVRTFSGDVKTVPYQEDMFQGPTNSEYGRVDGTNYVPDMAPRIIYRDDPTRMPPLPPPPGPPPPRRNSLRPPYQRNVNNRRDMERFRPDRVGDEMRMEMRKYKQDDFFMGGEEDLYYEEERRRDANPIAKLVKDTEKFLQRVTGGRRSPRPPPRREPDFGYLDGPGPGYEFRRMPEERMPGGGEVRSIAGSFNSSPAIRSFEAQKPYLPPGYYPEEPRTNDRPSFQASRAAQSFSSGTRERYRRQQTPYRMERQFNGDFRSVPVYDDDDYYRGNPAASSEVRRIR